MGPWVVLEQFSNGATYRVRDLASAQQRQLTRDQVKVIDLSGTAGDGIYQDVSGLPRLVIPDVGHSRVGAHSRAEAEPQPEDLLPEEWNVSPDDVPLATGEEREPAPESRYGLRPAAVCPCS